MIRLAVSVIVCCYCFLYKKQYGPILYKACYSAKLMCKIVYKKRERTMLKKDVLGFEAHILQKRLPQHLRDWDIKLLNPVNNQLYQNACVLSAAIIGQIYKQDIGRMQAAMQDFLLNGFDRIWSQQFSVIAVQDGRIIGTCLIYNDELPINGLQGYSGIRIGAVTVVNDMRGHGLGKFLMSIPSMYGPDYVWSDMNTELYNTGALIKRADILRRHQGCLAAISAFTPQVADILEAACGQSIPVRSRHDMSLLPDQASYMFDDLMNKNRL